MDKLPHRIPGRRAKKKPRLFKRRGKRHDKQVIMLERSYAADV